MYHMSRATHDAECPHCNFQGKVGDEITRCPKCHRIILYPAVTFGELTARIEVRNAKLHAQETKLSQG